MQQCFIGVDVGTASARAGVFSAAGARLAMHTQPIQIWRPQKDFAQQSSQDIWQAVCVCVRTAMIQAKLQPQDIKGIGFDATCSLVALDAQDRPVSISPDGQDIQNVVLWMDHRACEQAQRINAGGHDVLKYVGGVISPEMQTPKLLWIKENLPKTWQRTARWLDLPDFLTYRATGDDTRSLCTTVCKWTYLGHESPQMPGSIGRWDKTFFHAIGLGDLVDDGAARIGRRVRPMGEALGEGLTTAAAAELGLQAGTPVGVSIIDAHAGGLGLIGAAMDGQEADFDRRIALIGGTSSCHMAVSAAPRFVSGVWGPYFSVMVPGLWLTEGGQSATGALVDHVVMNFPGSAAAAELAARSNVSIYELLNAKLSELARQHHLPSEAEITADLHVCPYFHGNRSPRADASLRGMISGLKLSSDIHEMARLYLATIQAIAHGTRHIIDAMNAQGYRIDTILACGGGTRNPVFLRQHADISGCRLVLPREPEAVLLGSAILGAVAGGAFPSVTDAMAHMTAAGSIIEPQAGATAAYHSARHRVFLRMYEDQMAYRQMTRGQ